MIAFGSIPISLVAALLGNMLQMIELEEEGCKAIDSDFDKVWWATG